MINASRYRNNKKVPTMRMVACPACNKNRLTKYENDDGTIDAANNQTVDIRGEDRYLEACNICVAKYQRIDENFVIENMRKLARAMQDDKEEGGSDHKDFSLN